MENTDMKKCPYCAELIKAEAVKCRYCGSDLNRKTFNFDLFSTPGYWHRTDEGKKVAGVCTGIAKQLDASILILPLRLFFVLTTIFYGFGVILYVILWILMPPPPHESRAAAGRYAGPAAGAAAGYAGMPSPPPVEPSPPEEQTNATAGDTPGSDAGGAGQAGQPPAEPPEQSEPEKLADDDGIDDFRGGPGGTGTTDAEFIEIRDDAETAPKPDRPDTGGSSGGMKRVSNRLVAGGIAVIMILATYVMLLSHVIGFTPPLMRFKMFAIATGAILAGFTMLVRGGFAKPAGIME